MNYKRRYEKKEDVIICIRFYKDEITKLDKKRGTLNRSDYIRKKTLN